MRKNSLLIVLPRLPTLFEPANLSRVNLRNFRELGNGTEVQWDPETRAIACPSRPRSVAPIAPYTTDVLPGPGCPPGEPRPTGNPEASFQNRLAGVAGQLLPDGRERGVDSLGHAAHSNCRSQGDQSGNQRVLDQVLTGILTVQLNQGTLHS